MPSVEYHRSTEEVENVGWRDTRPRRTKIYHRFTILERVLVLTVIVLLFVTIALAVLFGISQNSGRNQKENEHKKNNGQNENCTRCNLLGSESFKQLQSLMESLDWSVDPCHNFYNFVCNRWMSEQVINNRQVTQFNVLEQKNREIIVAKLRDENATNEYKHIKAISKAQRDFSVCLSYSRESDETKFKNTQKFIDQFGGWNISTPDWSRKTWNLLPNLVKIHRKLSIFPLFFFKIGLDMKNTTKKNIIIRQWVSLLLQFRMFYLSNDSYSTEKRNHYLNKMLGVMAALSKKTKNDTAILRQAKNVFEFEKKLSEAAMSLSKFQKKKFSYKVMKIQELQEKTKHIFQWLNYFQEMFHDIDVTITKDTLVKVNDINYIKSMAETVEKTDNTTLANYLIWQVISDAHTFGGFQLPHAISEMYGNDQPEKIKSKCFASVRTVFGSSLSILYLHEMFHKGEETRFKKMMKRIHENLVKDINASSWMDSKTKQEALKKARKIKLSVILPANLENNDKLNTKVEEIQIKKNDYINNWIEKRSFIMKKNLKTYSMTDYETDAYFDPISSNAKYSATSNKVYVPAGILQPPFYDPSRPMSLNFGGIGMIIGHELTHAFDINGRNHDENGNLRNWWQNSSVMEYEKRSKCFTQQYSNMYFKGIKLNGEKSLGENMADSGGVRTAFEAYKDWRSENDEPDLSAFNLTSVQLFFVANARIWCSKYPSLYLKNVNILSHLPGMARVIGSLSNFPEFSKAFCCSVGSQMNPKEKCSLW
ncbi:neprilysin-3-like isoform X2 [Xenia sp. Carnegie-2017]|nr:neprilysin-3-like isoform X2 [Xenia sp. Carnegie-2017]